MVILLIEGISTGMADTNVIVVTPCVCHRIIGICFLRRNEGF